LTSHKELIQNTTIETDIRCLKAILRNVIMLPIINILKAEKAKGALTDTEADYVVPIEEFGNILKWFGPLTLRPYPPDGISILQKIRKLLQEP
jgi:hypothetical protein